jgi:hypothetical protein
MLESLQELSTVFSRDFSNKKSILNKMDKKFVFEHKIKSQIEFSMRMLIEKQNHNLARANSTILEIRKDLEETTGIVKNSMVQLDERERGLFEVELR